MKNQSFPDVSQLDTLTQSRDVSPPYLVNVFATWCAPCIAELPYLQQIGARSGIPIIGIAWKDKPDKLPQWLETHGNPFDIIYLDNDGDIGITLGVSGLPESYLVDKAGNIHTHHRGIIKESDIPEFLTTIKQIQ